MNKKYILLNLFFMVLSLIFSFAICYYFLDIYILRFTSAVSLNIYILVRAILSIFLFIIIKSIFSKNINFIFSNTIVNGMTGMYIFSLIVLLFGRNENYGAINLIPFKTILNYVQSDINNEKIIANIIGNIILFIPFGIILKTKINNNIIFIILSIIILLSIEILQFILKLGVLDIDDVLLNGLGFFIGYIFFMLFKSKINSNNGWV